MLGTIQQDRSSGEESKGGEGRGGEESGRWSNGENERTLVRW